ncbi:MAG TPA: HNH endonuclease signature motif containing protein, partial [Nitriliruptoraceae bacterium]|nr:HNH endonuclease signature motif containing protein [Nitriliruptoraceae bacterium]
MAAGPRTMIPVGGGVAPLPSLAAQVDWSGSAAQAAVGRLLGTARELDATVAQLVEDLICVVESGATEQALGAAVEIVMSQSCRMVGFERRTLLRASTTLVRMPATRQAFRDGRVSWSQVRAVLTAVRPLRIADLVDVDDLVGELADTLATCEADALVHEVDWHVDQVIAQRQTARRRQPIEDNRLIPLPRLDGSGAIHGDFDAAHFPLLVQAIDNHAADRHPLDAVPDPDACVHADSDAQGTAVRFSPHGSDESGDGSGARSQGGPGDTAHDGVGDSSGDRLNVGSGDPCQRVGCECGCTRCGGGLVSDAALTAAHAHATTLRGRNAGRRALALFELATGMDATTFAGLDPDRRPTARPSVLVTCHLDSLLDGSTPAWVLSGLAGRMKADAATVRAWANAQGADVRLIAMDDVGQVVGVGRRARFATGWLRDAIIARDLHDTAPASTTPATVCDIDHVRDWHKGGRTDVDNLTLLSRRFNRAKQQG